MKKLLLTFVATCAAIAMQAAVITDQLTVTVNGESSNQPASIEFIDNGDGTCNFCLPNFVLVEGTNEVPIGNINIQNLTLNEEGSYSTFTYNDIIFFEEGDSTYPMWMGPMMFSTGCPIVLTGKVDREATKLYVSITIDIMDTLGQIVEVVFGSDEFDSLSVKPSTLTLSGSKVCFGLDGRKANKGILIQNGMKVIR